MELNKETLEKDPCNFCGKTLREQMKGCNEITSRGVEISTTNGFANGTGDDYAESGSFGTGTFTINVTGLLSNTTYYYKAFATSTSGTAYSEQGTFTTNSIAAPVALAGTLVGSDNFTANWEAVSGATSYEIDVYESNVILASDLFISEYVEGSSNNKYIEIFNGTGATVDLSDYRLRLFANGSASAGSDIQLSGNLANGATVVYRNSGATIYAGTTIVSGATNFNGDDALALFKISANSNVDIFGRIGNDPGTQWTGAGGYSTLDKTLVRKSSVTSGVSVNPTGTGASAFTTLTTEWDLYDIDDVSDLGSHTFNAGSISYVIQNQNVGSVTSYQVTGLDPETTYFYVVRALDATSESVNSNEIEVETAPIITWNGTEWSNVDGPTITDDAVIAGIYDSTGSLSAKNLTVMEFLGEDEVGFTLNPGHTLTLSGSLINNGDEENVVFNSGSYFIQTSDAANTGEVTITRSAQIKLLDIVLWSSPVEEPLNQQYSPHLQKLLLAKIVVLRKGFVCA
jgi:hypothetical protein